MSVIANFHRDDRRARRLARQAPNGSDCDLTHHFVTGTTYDDLGRVTRTTTPAGLVDRTYDPATHLPASLRGVAPFWWTLFGA